MLAIKYQRMRTDAFVFFRETCHLFYEDWPTDSPLSQSPLAGICGDLHPHNFGSYEGENWLSYFAINDFDKAVFGPCLWGVALFTAPCL